MFKYIVAIFTGHLHKWSKWEESSNLCRFVWSKSDDTFIQKRQKRKCEKCGKVEEEVV